MASPAIVGAATVASSHSNGRPDQGAFVDQCAIPQEHDKTSFGASTRGTDALGSMQEDVLVSAVVCSLVEALNEMPEAKPFDNMSMTCGHSDQLALMSVSVAKEVHQYGCEGAVHSDDVKVQVEVNLSVSMFVTDWQTDIVKTCIVAEIHVVMSESCVIDRQTCQIDNITEAIKGKDGKLPIADMSRCNTSDVAKNDQYESIVIHISICSGEWQSKQSYEKSHAEGRDVYRDLESHITAFEVVGTDPDSDVVSVVSEVFDGVKSLTLST